MISVTDRRRLNPRLEIELPAEYQIGVSDEPRQGMIANLSAGGAAILTETQLPPHSLVDQFRFALPVENGSQEALEASAVVVHAHPFLTDEGNISYFSGLHFLGFESQAFERLEEFVVQGLARAGEEPSTS
jgi:c-di-GMP-binding flagellar brake protein YcgR